MDIFDSPAPKRARTEQVIIPHCNDICSASSECNRDSRCLFNRRNTQAEPEQVLFPDSPEQINPQPIQSPVPILELSSDEEGPLDLTVPHHSISPPQSSPINLSSRQIRPSVIKFAPAVITISDSESDYAESDPEPNNDQGHQLVIDAQSNQESDPEPNNDQGHQLVIETQAEPVQSFEQNQIPAAKKSKKGSYKCMKCGKNYVYQLSMENHQLSCGLKMCTANPANVPASYDGFTLMAKAFANYYLVYRYLNTNQRDLDSLFAEIRLPIFSLLNIIVSQLHTMKYYFIVHLTFHDEITGRSQEIRFASSMHIGLIADIKESSVAQVNDEIEERIDQYTQRGSGWTLSNINAIDLLFGKFIPHQGGCARHKLPDKLANKKCLISPETDTDCFMYSILIGLHTANYHRERISHYSSFISNYDFSMVRGIVPVTNIKKFEKKNPVSVNVYTFDFETKKVVPMKVVDDEKEKHVNIFLHDEHYYTITDMNRLVNTNNSRSRYVCFRCLSSYRLKEELAIHKPNCNHKQPQLIIMPKISQAICKRYNYRKEVAFPFCIYADFETLSVPRDTGGHILTDLVPCSYGYIVVDWDDKIIHKDFYLGDQVGKKFLSSLKNVENFLNDYLERRRIRDHNLTQEQEQEFQAALLCHICGSPLGRNRVRDHDHLTGYYRGAAHQQCNLEYRVPEQIPVVLHNLKNFDGHIIISALDIDFCKEPKIIPHNMEKYIGFILGKFKFIDSFAFLPSSLDNLAANIHENSKTHYLQQLFGEIDISLLLKKSALPYEYLTSLDVFNQSTLPEKNAFYSSLKDSNITNEMYEHLEKVWSNFDCHTLKDLHDIYLKVDVLLLAAVFENFRKMSINNFGLDPLHQFSSPGLTWSALLKTTRIELALFTDVDMFLMIENHIRGGLTMLTTKHVKANNKYLPDYDASQPSSFLLYLDVNNLYGYAMSERLPVSGFKWSSRSTTEILNTPDDSDIGFILEVDLEYPQDLHDFHNDFPLCPERREINETMYSPYQKSLIDHLKQQEIKANKSSKLTTNFYKKERYVVHYRTLKFYIANGISITKIHRVIEFKQSAWLSEYVKFCTSKRQSATSDFEKDFWKLLVNSIYGKTIEDVRKYRSIKIALQDIAAQKHLRRHHCQKFMILDENKIIFWMKKLLVKMNKPIVVGFMVLELAKLKMYSLHYNTFKSHYNQNINLVYTDTDSLIYEIKTEDIVTDLRSFSSMLDFSDYPKDHPLYSNVNNKKIGFLKDEMAGQQIAEFVGIRPKLYALKTQDQIKKRAKGVPRSVLEKKITFDDYIDCLYNQQVTIDSSNNLQSNNHYIQMICRKKVMLSPLDDKRYWLNKLTSLAYGHHKIDN